MRRFPLLCVAVLSLATLARADQQTQAAQQALKDQGFYYGQVDGQPGPETDAAIKRYQIRQGLDVTGKLDEQTLDSLKLGGGDSNKSTLEAVPPPSADSAPRETPAPKVVEQDDHDFLKRHPTAATPAPAPDEETAPQPPPPAQQPPPEQAEGQTAPEQYAGFFRRTPYESAPPVVQRSTVQRAQDRLAHDGFYRGIVDGELSDSLRRALVAYQRDADIAPSGRLDMETLSDMNLLPRRRVVVRPPAPYDVYPPPARDVYRGIWVH